LSSVFNFVIRHITKINKWLTIYYIVFHRIVIRRINRKSIIHKCIACYGVVAGRGEVDAFILVVAGDIARNDVVAGMAECNAVLSVAVDSIARKGIVAGRLEADTVTAVVAYGVV
jgi:hypothetical protein